MNNTLYTHQLLELLCDLKNTLHHQTYYTLAKKKQSTTPNAPPATAQTLHSLAQKVSLCANCRLAHTRTHTVYGEGPLQSPLMIIGEAPGHEEDKKALPFVGLAGELLTRMLRAISVNRERIYITNIVKCRPPSNRNPHKDEIQQCLPYLQEQIRLVQPQIILTLGNVATHVMLDSTIPISKLRGKAYPVDGRTLIPTYHPAALLRNESLKRPTWEDLKMLKSLLIERNLFTFVSM